MAPWLGPAVRGLQPRLSITSKNRNLQSNTNPLYLCLPLSLFRSLSLFGPAVCQQHSYSLDLLSVYLSLSLSKSPLLSLTPIHVDRCLNSNTNLPGTELPVDHVLPTTQLDQRPGPQLCWTLTTSLGLN